MNEINIRFKEALDFLINKGYVNGNKHFADKIGISPSMVSEIISGRTSVGIRTLLGFATFFAFISVSWLLTGKGSMIEPINKQSPDAANEALRQENQALKQKNREIEEKLNAINKVLKGKI